MPVRVVGFDGDDTLWHSETRFHVTQAEFRELLHRHVPDMDVDTPLAEMEMKNLAIYGYGFPGEHVAVCLGGGMVFSHGSEAGPFKLRLHYRPDLYQIRRYI